MNTFKGTTFSSQGSFYVQPYSVDLFLFFFFWVYAIHILIFINTFLPGFPHPNFLLFSSNPTQPKRLNSNAKPVSIPPPAPRDRHMEGTQVTLFKIPSDRVEPVGLGHFPRSQGTTGLLSYCEALCKSTGWWPEAKYSLQMCFVRLEQCFKQFLISYQHLTIRFHVKFSFLISKRIKMLKLWGLSTLTWGSACSLIDHILHPPAASTYSVCLIFIET